jgi:creatinine amidohydrolase
MNESVDIAEIDWVEYDRRVRAGSTVFLPVSSTEQHGLHTPLGCDAIVGGSIARAVAAKINGMVAPAITYGYKSQPRTGGGDHFPGNVSLDGETISQLVRDITLEFVRHGVKNIVILDSHYENHWFIIEGIEEASDELKRQSVRDVKIVKVRYNELCSEETIERIFGKQFLGWELEHAAVMTTSLLLHLRPEIVNMGLASTHEPVCYPPYDKFPFDTSLSSPTGALSAAIAATAEKGKIFFEEYVEKISELLFREFKLIRSAG